MEKASGIAVMAKASKAGRTKTRLSPPLTPEECARFNTAFLKDIASNLLEAARDVSLTGAMAFGPPGHESFFIEHLPPEIVLHEVWYPDFGECLTKALSVQFDAGHQVACLLNSDSPTLPPSILIDAVNLLNEDGDRVVIGPSNDGGYYFIGCKTIHPRLFEEITWSTEAVFGQTLDRAAEAGIEVHLLPEWYDVDDAAALRILADELLRGRAFHPELTSAKALHSKALLEELVQGADLAGRLDRFGQAATISQTHYSAGASVS